MHLNDEWLHFHGRLKAMRDEKAVHGPKVTAHVDRTLARLEAGLYPTCEACGERIEMDRLKANAVETKCWKCGSGRRPAAS
jgi:RNA polymerase-binding transcription factor DksA